MDTNAIGEYLKRLRLRANYTQSEVGKHINVTDKAISRWESGQGMPELGNLVVIAELFGVTVDDILHCNEKVFESSESGGQNGAASESVESGEQEKRQTESESESAKAVSEAKSRSGASLFDKFQSVILSAALTLGIFVSLCLPYFEDNLYSHVMRGTIFPIIMFIVFAFLYAALPFVSRFLPKKTGLISKTALSAACAVTALVLTLIFAAYYNGAEYADEFGREMTAAAASLGAAVLFLLFVSSLMYSLTEFFRKELAKKIIFYVCAGLGGIMVILGIVGITKQNCDFIDLLTGYPDAFMTLCCLLFGLISIAFALRSLNIAGMGVTTTVLLFMPAVLFIFGSFNLLELFESYFPTRTYNQTLLCGIAALSPAVRAIGYNLEKTKYAKNAARITAVIAFLLFIACAYYTFDIFSLNAYLDMPNINTVVFLRISVFIAATAYFAATFIPERKGEKAL